MAIITVVVGLLVVTCGVLLAYVLYRGQQSVEILKRDYLGQVADTTVREAARLPQPPRRCSACSATASRGYYSTNDEIGLARALAGALQAEPDIKWVSYSEATTGRFMGHTDSRVTISS